MKKQLVVIYDTDSNLNGLIVIDPEEQLPNGKYNTIKILLGDYADDVYRDLTEDKA